MQFVKLVALYHLDPAVSEDLSDAGEVAFTRSIGYCGAAETSGFIPAGQMPSLIRKYTPAKARKVAGELVAAGLWVEVKGGWQLRTWQKHQDELERLLARRKADADRQRRHRQKPPQGLEPEPEPDDDAPASQPLSRDKGRDVSRDMERDRSRNTSRNSLSRVRGPEELEIDEELKPLLPLVCRRLSSGAREKPTDDELILWCELVGDADLRTELKAWLMFNADVDLRNPGAALHGWLRHAGERVAKSAGCGSCDRGWLPEHPDTGAPIPCPTCRPHLRSAEAS